MFPHIEKLDRSFDHYLPLSIMIFDDLVIISVELPLMTA